MMGLINQTDDQGRRFGPGYFDLIVIDEAHRSVYQKYRAIFAYFDSLLVGLTATPKDEVDRNTYSLFHLENGVPTDAYSLDEAVQEGYLVPPVAVSVPLKFQRQGIRYDELSEEEKDQWDSMEWSDDGDVPDVVEADAVSKWLFNTDTVDKALQTLMVHGRKVAGGGRLGKTIIFDKNTAHAEFIEQRFNLAYPEYAGHFGRLQRNPRHRRRLTIECPVGLPRTVRTSSLDVLTSAVACGFPPSESRVRTRACATSSAAVRKVSTP